MYIITGGAGFLGSALVWQLNQRGVDNILIVDNLACTEKWKNLRGLKYENYMQRDDFLHALRKNRVLEKKGQKLEGVVHLGACSSTTESDADFLMRNNFHYSRDLCRFALEQGARFLQASSAATYGDGTRGFDDDVTALDHLRPLNMYGYSKHLFDLWARRERVLDQVACLKFFNVYGPNEYHKGTMRSVVCKAHAEIRDTGRLRLFRSTSPDYADGGQMRDFVYVKDCVRIMAWLLEHPAVGGIFNVGTGQARTWNALGAAVFEALELPVNIEYVDMPDTLRGKYQNYTEARMDRLLAHACPACDTSLEEGVREYVCGYLEKALRSGDEGDRYLG